MTRTDRYLLSQFLSVFGFFALVLIVVYWINRAVSLFDELIDDGQSVGLFLELTALSLPALIRIVLPLAAFGASLWVTNRLATDSELTVMQSAGMGPFRLARPVLVFGLVVTLLVSLLSHILVPASVSRMNALQAEIARDATTSLLREGEFLTPSEGVTLYIRQITPEGELRDIFLSDSRDAREMLTYTATRAFLVRADRGPQLVMLDGMSQRLDRQTGRLGVTSFEDLAYDIGALIRSPDLTRRSARELSTPELLRPTPALEDETGRTAGQLVAEGHGRFAEALLAVTGALIGFATLLVGGFSRFGVWRQVVAAVFLVIAVKTIEGSVVGAVRGDPALWPLIYLPSATGLLAAAGLLHLAGRPRRLPRTAALPA